MRWLKGKKQERDKDHTSDPTDKDTKSGKSGSKKKKSNEKGSDDKSVEGEAKERSDSREKEGEEESKDENTETDEEDQSINPVLLAYPVRNDLVDWEMNDDGIITIIYTKNFGKFERWLHKKIGGPERIRRPLDAPGSRMWSMCDGKHTIMEICAIIDKEFKEEMDPVFRKVRMFLEQLLILNLIILESKEELDKKAEEEENEDDPEKEKEEPDDAKVMDDDNEDGPEREKKESDDAKVMDEDN